MIKDKVKAIFFIIFAISSLVSVWILRMSSNATREEYSTFTTIVFTISIIIMLYLYFDKKGNNQDDKEN